MGKLDDFDWMADSDSSSSVVPVELTYNERQEVDRIKRALFSTGDSMKIPFESNDFCVSSVIRVLEADGYNVQTIIPQGVDLDEADDPKMIITKK